MTVTMADERRFKDDAEKRLAEMTATMEGERMANNASRKQLIKMTKKMEGQRKARNSAELRLAEMEKKMDDERKAKTKQQLVDVVGKNTGKMSLDRPSDELDSSGSIDGPINKKQKVLQPSADKYDNGTLLVNVNEFVKTCLVPKEGHFTKTKLIQDSFLKKYQIKTDEFREKVFHTMLKECISSIFTDQSFISASRTRQAGERLRGYAGLMLLVDASGVGGD
jgi:hypothetical protein